MKIDVCSGIYIHIPFCLQKCDYCDFLSFEVNEQTQNAYVNTLLHEMRSVSIDHEVSTIYIGGGTPTALPSHLLCKIIAAAKTLAPSAIEITVEANPGTLTREYLAGLKSHGVTRLSMGLQTTKPHLLRAINRLHSMTDFLDNFHAAREAGFDNINVDLMFALPGQTLQEWQETLTEIIALSPEHISAYSLTPAENTPLWSALENGKIHLPSDETDRDMYHMARKCLADAGYIHYELSNFAKPGYESRHNVNCWRRVPYHGFGLGAHSFDGVKRWHNTEDMGEYLAGHHTPQGIDELSEADIQAEIMILGLRLTEGIRESEIPQAFKGEVEAQKIKRACARVSYRAISYSMKKGLLALENGYVKLTARGMDLANQVFEAFL